MTSRSQAATDALLVSVANGQSVATNATARFPITVNCRADGGCAGATIKFTRPKDAAGHSLTGPMVVGLASGANEGITYTIQDANTDNPSITFTRLDNNISQIFDVTWATKDPYVIPGTYTANWSVDWPAQGYSTGGTVSVPVTGTPQSSIRKIDNTGTSTSYPGQFRNFQLQYIRPNAASQPGLTGVTTRLVDQLPEGYKFMGFNENGVGPDMLLRSTDGINTTVYSYDATKRQVIIDITPGVDAYITTKNNSFGVVNYQVQVQATKTDGTKLVKGEVLTNTFSATNTLSLDGKPYVIAPQKTQSTFTDLPTGTYGKGRGLSEYHTTTADSGGVLSLPWNISASNPYSDARTIKISDRTSWQKPLVLNDAAHEDIRYVTSVKLAPVAYEGATVSYPATVIGYRADGTTVNYQLQTAATLAIPQSDKIVGVDIIVDNVRPTDPSTTIQNNGVLVATVTHAVGIKTDQIAATMNASSIQLINTASISVNDQLMAAPKTFYTIRGAFPNATTTVSVLAGENGTQENLDKGESFNIQMGFNALPGSPVVHPEAFLILPQGFTLGDAPKLESIVNSRCQSTAADWKIEKAPSKFGSEIWRLTMVDGKVLDPTKGANIPCLKVAVTAKDPLYGTRSAGLLTDPNHGIQTWIREMPKPDGTDSIAHADMNIPDYADLNSDGRGGGQWKNAAMAVSVAQLTSLAVSKSAKGDVDEQATSWIPGTGEVVSTAKNTVDFTITGSTNGTSPVKDMVLYDMLPTNDTSVTLVEGFTNTDNNVTTFKPVLAGPVSAVNYTGAFTVYYTTSTNPCRPELTSDTEYPNNVGCSSFNARNEWSTSIPADPSSVTAIRVQLRDQVFGSVSFKVPMKLPAQAIDGSSLQTSDLATNRVAAGGQSSSGAKVPFVGPAYARVAPTGNIQVNKWSVIKDVKTDQGPNDPAPVIRRGDEFLWAIQATADPAGAGVASPVINESLPHGVDFLGLSTDPAYQTDGSYNAATGEWQPGDIDSGQSKYLYLRVRASATGAGDMQNFAAYDSPFDNKPLDLAKCVAGTNNTTACDVNTVHIDAGDGSISGVYSLDANRNNVRDAGDTGRAGMMVRLKEVTKDASGNEVLRSVAQTYTDQNGAYTFGSLPGGNYKVLFQIESTTEFDQPNVGGNDAIDSDAIAPVTVSAGTFQATATIPLAQNAAVRNVDVGVKPLATIKGTVFKDEDGDGKNAGADSPIGGQTVQLIGANGQVVATTTTAADGSYTFTDQVPGTYSIKVVNYPAGLVPTTLGSDDIAAEGFSDIQATGQTASFVADEGTTENIDAGL
ncbi:SdrD B-like domain-containing protein [Staphylococcus chromogenes]|nr:SdrD B-like domain-containing protein [Staphylococcus chromogenes]